VSLIPSWQAPDEPGHVGYISYLYNERKIPSSFKNYIATSIYKSTFLKTHDASFDLNDRRYTSKINVGSHPPLYYVVLVPFYWLAHFFPSSWTLFLLRLPNVVIGVCILLVIYRFTNRLFRKELLSAIVTILIALQPMFSFITAIVNSDALVMLLYLLVVYLGWHIIHAKKQNSFLWIPYILITALAPLSKPHLAITALLVAYVTHTHTKSWWYTIRNTLLSILPFLVWITYNISTYGSQFIGYVVMNQKPTYGNLFIYPLAFIAEKQPVGIWMSFWGFFGWLNVAMPKWTYVLFFICIVLGLIGWMRKKPPFHTDRFIAGSAMLYLASIVLYDLQYYLLSHTLAIQGRYLAVCLPFLIWFTIKGILRFPMHIKLLALSFVMTAFVMGQIAMFITLYQTYQFYFL
jgi:4-amino-4-deoxy-L-arabinose transferase-like glycosyltransferase